MMQKAELGDMPADSIGTHWQLFTDSVMGGRSQGTLIRDAVAGRSAMRMQGTVSLENNGGFIQMGVDLATQSGAFDASSYRGVELDVFGNDQVYSVHLRTFELTKPWQSYRQTFKAEVKWRTIALRFENFVPHRTEVPLDVSRLRRISVAAIGRAFTVDVAISAIRFF